MSPIRLGVIGLSTQGWAATELIPHIFDPLLADKYTLVALCTSSAESAKTSAAKYTDLAGRTVKAYHGKNGYTEIANDPEVDMVVVSIRMPLHYEAIIPAIEAGKDVFVEWAPGKNLEETLQIAEAAKAKGVRSLVGGQATHSVALNKAKELIDAGKIGRVLSTSLVSAEPGVLPLYGKTIIDSYSYITNIDNGASSLTIHIGHFLVGLSHVLGELAEVSAISAIRHPTATVVDAGGKPTGEVLTKTTHDQLVLSGILKGKHAGTVLNLHHQSGASPNVPRFVWTIYGEDGIIELRARPDAFTSSIVTSEKDVFLNGEPVELLYKDEDRLKNTGKAWLEFAKGDAGSYLTLDHAAEIYRAVDAASTSIKEGRKVVV